MSKTWRYVLGGAVIGAVLGAALGVGASKMAEKLPAENSAGVAKRPMDVNQAFQLGMSVFGLVRQIIELGR